MNTHRYSAPRANLLLALGCAALLPAVLAQEAPTPSAAEAPAKIDEPVVELSPFEVKAEKDEGYMAQNTTSGSRLNTSLKDTAAPISVFTQEFLTDIGATDIASLADYTVNTERLNGIVGDVANGNEFSGPAADLRVRGLATARMVNFFARGGEVDVFNTERVELSRGPNALLFGLGGAGGAFNTSTKKADLNRPAQSVTLRVGDYDAVRTSVDINQPIIRGKLGLRVNALDSSKNSWRPHEYSDSQRLAIAGRWQVTSKITANAEYELSNTNRATQRAWASFDSYTDWHKAGDKLDPKVAAPGLTLAQTRAALGISALPVSTATTTAHRWTWNATDGQLVNYSSPLAVNAQSFSAQTVSPVSGVSGPQDNPMLLDFSVVPMDVSIGGPGVGNLSKQKVFTANVTAELAKNLFLDVAYNYEGFTSDGYDIGNQEIRIQWDTSPTTVTGAVNPHAGQPFIEILPNRRFQDSSTDDLRLTASYETPSFGKWLGRHRVSALMERRTAKIANISYGRMLVVNPANTATPESPNNTVRYRTYVDLAGPVEAIASDNFREDPTGRTAWVPVQTPTDVKRITDTLMAATQSYFWNDRIVATVGYRDDRLENYDSTLARGPAYGSFAVGNNNAVRNTVPTSPAGITRTQGVVFHATSWASLFYNTSSSFNPGGATQRLARNTQVPNADGVSDDLGVKISLLNGKIFATVTYYETASQNDSGFLNQNVSSGGINAIWDALNTTILPGDTQTILAKAGLNYSNVLTDFNSYTLDTASQGWEYDLVANPTPNWRLSLSFADRKSSQTNTAPELFAYMDQYRALWTANSTVVTANGQTVATRLAGVDGDHLTRLVRPDGLQKVGDARYSSTLRTNYTFRDGFLKGFSAGGGVRWRGKTLVGYDAALAPLETKGYTLVDATLGYRTKASVFGHKTDLSFQLNISNLFNEDDLVPSRLYDNGVIRTYRFQTVRDIFLTMTAKF